jgi:hypothetical protein
MRGYAIESTSIRTSSSVVRGLMKQKRICVSLCHEVGKKRASPAARRWSDQG